MQSIIIKADIESTHNFLRKGWLQACKWLIRGKYETKMLKISLQSSVI